MKRRGLKSERIFALFVLAVVAFNPPFLHVFDRGGDDTVMGIPVLIFYIFGIWMLLILLLARVIGKGKERNADAANRVGKP